MSKVQKGSIDLMQIDDDAIKPVTLKAGKPARFLTFAIIETPQQERSSHVIVQDMGKDKDGNYIKGGPIIGNVWRKQERRAPNQEKPKAAGYDAPVDDVPF